MARNGFAARDDHRRLVAVADGLPAGFAFAGLTAAGLLGLEPRASRRPEVFVPRRAVIRGRVAADVERVDLAPGDVVTRGAFPVTSPARTCFDVANRLVLTEALVLIDAALHANLLTLDELRRYVAAREHVAGVVRARRTVEFAEPRSESPMETRLRMLLVRAGLPRPEAQVPVVDAETGNVFRLDLFYRPARLGVEYDGDDHRERLAEDSRRQDRLRRAGISLLRYTYPDLRDRPAEIVADVRRALSNPAVR